MVKKSRTTSKTKRRKKPTAKLKPQVVGKGKTMKTLAELSSLRESFAAEIAGGVALGCCWFKDPSGRDYGMPSASSQSCTNAGGAWDPAPCPNT
jgi:hypothetical protein